MTTLPLRNFCLRARQRRTRGGRNHSENSDWQSIRCAANEATDESEIPRERPTRARFHDVISLSETYSSDSGKTVFDGTTVYFSSEVVDLKEKDRHIQREGRRGAGREGERE